MGFLKRFLKWIGIFVGFVLLIIIAVGIAIMLIVDKPFVESKMEEQLHRQVRIGDFSGGIFSALSGFTVKDVRISNYKTEKELESLKGKAVADNDLFVSLKSFNFKVAIPPLLKKQFVLKELMLYSPQINIVRYKSGAFNFSDLLVPKKLTPEERLELEKKMKEEAEKPKEPSKPLKADDIPVAINIGSIGMEDGNINFVDMASEQKINIYKVTAKVYDIKIDPANLEKNDSVLLKVFAGIKTTGRKASGSVESFDIGFDINGNVIPFDKKTRVLNPEIFVKAGSPYGKVTGLQIFNEMMNVEQLAKYSGKIDFLKKEIDWKNGYVKIHFKDNIVTFEEGRFANDDYGLAFGGKINTSSMGLDLKSDMTLAAKHTVKMKEKTEKLVDKALTGKMREYVKASDIADVAIKPLLNEKGEVFLKYEIKGTAEKPKVALVHPVLKALSDVIKDATKDVASQLADKAKDVAKEKAEEKLKGKTDKATEKASQKLKKLF